MTVEGEQVKTAPQEKSAITTLTDGIKRQVPFAIEHSISADQINIEYLSLQDLLQGMDESERREVQPLVDGMILAWHERREKEKYYIVEGLQELYNNSVPDIIEAYVDRMNHASRESARPQPEEDGDIKLSTEDMKTLVKCFKGNEDNAIKFWKAINQFAMDTEKTDLVNKLVRVGLISDNYKHHVLFTLLKSNGLYGKSESNWYHRVL